MTAEQVEETARRWHARAVEAYAAARPARAQSAARRALTTLSTVPDERTAKALRARCLITLALAESELSGPAAGRELLDAAQQLVDELGDLDTAVLVRSQRGALAIRSGDLVAARAEYAYAIELVEHAAPFDQVVILDNSAIVHMYLGDLRSARPLFARAAGVAAAAGLARQQAMALHNLGYVEFLGGDLPKALQDMQAAADVTSDLPAGIPLLDRARVLAEAGLLREAESALAQAGELFARDRLHQDLAEVELQRAQTALMSGDVLAARRLAARARDRFRRRGNDRWRRSAELTLLQGDLAVGRPGLRLAPPAMRLRDELANEGLRLLAHAAGLIAAEALTSAGRTSKAAQVLAGLPAVTAADPASARLHSAYVHARVDAAVGRGAVAARRVRRALAELAQYQASFGSIDLRTAAAVHGRRLAELDITLARQSGRVAPVFAAVERARAVSSRLPAIRPPDDPAAADLLAELRQTIESLRMVEQDHAASDPLLRRRRELERQIVARSWTRSGSGAALRPTPLGAVRARLADRDKTMVTYVQAAGRLTAVVIGERVRLHDLGPSAPVVEWVRRTRADLDVLAQPRLPGAIRGAVRSSLERSLGELDRAVLRPLRVPGSLVIVSTGLLGQVPWASLPSLRGCPLVVAPSATKWHASAAPATARPLSITALAGPDLGRGSEEVEAVAAVWPDAEVLSGPHATTAALTTAMGSASVLHVAAHGMHQPENPLFSCVRMVDGPVFAHELDQTHRAPEHVVLSACEVGLATIRPGDEALGLASVLLHLGTRSVIAGVARVGDEVAEQTMAAYHRRLAAGAASSVALAEALVEVDADVTPPFVNFGAAWAPDLEPAKQVA